MYISLTLLILTFTTIYVHTPFLLFSSLVLPNPPLPSPPLPSPPLPSPPLPGIPGLLLIVYADQIASTPLVFDDIRLMPNALLENSPTLITISDAAGGCSLAVHVLHCICS